MKRRLAKPAAVAERRHFILSSAGLMVAGSCGAMMKAQAATMPTVLVVGDSLSAEYGLRRGSGWVALLAEKGQAEKPGFQVINASISGDTTSGGRARLGALLTQHKPQLVVIELGGNDALRGLPIKMTEDNLTQMVRASQKAGARVLLVGMQVPPNYGAAYTEDFSRTFARVAAAEKTGLVPFLLKGIADGPDAERLFQADRIHPREEAHPRMLANVWPELRRLLK